MINDYITCSECGASYYRKDNHECPGSDDDRLYDLERRVGELEEEKQELRRRIEALEGDEK